MEYLIRIDANDYVWCVVDPQPGDRLCDVVFATTLRGIAMDLPDARALGDRNHWSVYLHRSAAITDAEERLKAMTRRQRKAVRA